MYFFIIFLTAIGLAMDAFAVSIVNSAGYKAENRPLLTSLMFGLFQFLMTLIGWFAAAHFLVYFLKINTIIAFCLLLFIGVKMICNGIKPAECNLTKKISFNSILLLSIATSLDALAVGMSFSLVGYKILFPSILIGLVAFCLSIIGSFIGKKIGSFIGNKMEIFGGIILILIGIKLLFL